MRTQATPRGGLHVVALVMAALVLAGCVRVEMDLELQADDTVDGVVVFAFSEDLARVLDPETVWEQMGSGPGASLPESATSEPYAEDGYTGTRLTFEDSPFTEMTAVDDPDALRIIREGDELVVSGAMDMTGSNNPMGDLGASLGDSLEFRIAITFPDEVLEHNGTLSGRTVVWEPRAGERTDISARGIAGPGAAAGDGTRQGAVGEDGDRGGAGAVGSSGGRAGLGAFAWLPVVVVAVVGIGLAALIAVSLLVVRSRRAQPVAGAKPAYPPPTAYPQQAAPVNHSEARAADPHPGAPPDRAPPAAGHKQDESQGPVA